MRRLIERARAWFLEVPNEALRTSSMVAALAASTIAWIDSAQLFMHIVADRVVAVPRIEVFSVNAWTAALALGFWAVGTVAFVFPRIRRILGWMAPLGAIAASVLDKQVFSDIAFLIVLALVVHLWSWRLEQRADTAHLRGVPLRILQAQISIVFLWTAIAKLNPRFLSGAVLSTSFLGPVPAPDFLLQRQVLVALAVATVFGEAVLAVALWIERIRPLALTAAVGFHVLILLFFRPTLALAAFACIMGSGYLLFAAEPWAKERPDRESSSLRPKSSGPRQMS
jgi:hypothetical protein